MCSGWGCDPSMCSNEKEGATPQAYDLSLAAALRILDIVGASAGERKAILLARILFTVLEAMHQAEERRPPPGFSASAN
jgi:hypothetical protein